MIENLLPSNQRVELKY